MCELYILLAFGLGLFSGWLINFLLTGKYIEKVVDSYYSKDKKEELKAVVHKEHRNFRLSTLFWVVFLFASFMFLVYILSTTPTTKNQAANALEKADNQEVFKTLVDAMKYFSR